MSHHGQYAPMSSRRATTVVSARSHWRRVPLVYYRSIIGRSRGRYAAAGFATAGLSLVGVAAPATATLPAAPSDPPTAPSAATELSQRPVFEDGRYVVLLQQAPTASYDGGLRGYDATVPGDGKKFDADSRSARRYDALLDRRQERIIARADIQRQRRLGPVHHGDQRFHRRPQGQAGGRAQQGLRRPCGHPG